MRRTPASRLGAFGLALLMQVFVVSSLLHPCCLTGDMAPVGGASSVGAAADAAPPHEVHGHGSHGVVVDGHAAAGHMAAGHAAAGDMSAGHAASAHANAQTAAAHSGHGHSGSDDSGCEGRCGFCCQVAGFTGVPAPPVAEISAAEIAASIARFAIAEVRGSDTAYLLPWANAPPVRFDIV